MASKVTKTQEIKTEETQAPAIALKATVSMESYQTDTGEVQTYVSVLLQAPFPEEDFDQIRIVPKWRSTKGLFEFKAKKMLKTCDSFEILGEVRPTTYFSKRTRKQVTYPGLYFVDPFAMSTEEELIPFSIKREEDAAVFAMLVSERFSLALESDVAPAEEKA